MRIYPKKTFSVIVKFLLLMCLSMWFSCDWDMMGGDPIYENESSSVDSSNSGFGSNSNDDSNSDPRSDSNLDTVITVSDAGSDPDAGSEITVSKVKNFVDKAGATATNVQIVHQDGLDDPNSLMDIDTVIVARANGDNFTNDIVFSYDGIYRETTKFSNLNSTLYLDTDNDPNTGYVIEGIGADVRLSNIGINLSVAKFTYFDMLHEWLPSNSGNTSATIIISKVEDFVNVVVIVTSTDSLLSSQETDSILALEEIDKDENTILNRLGLTLPFVLPIL